MAAENRKPPSTDAWTLPMKTPGEDPKPFVWTKTADQILADVERFCKRALDT